MKVLIVDDELYMVEYIRKLIDWESYGFDTVMTAKGGSLARDLLLEHEPELLITDIRMPRVSGLDLSQMTAENNGRTKVIIISGYGDFAYAQQALRYGVSEYLVKPVLKQDLAEAVERLVPEMAAEAVQNEGEEENFQEEGSFKKTDTIAYIKKFIRENYDKDLSLDVLGDAAHLHPAYLSRVFKEATQENLSGYIASVRMEKAAQLLEETDLRIHEVMRHVGYQKSQHFAKLFREKFGVTPTEYRQGLRGFGKEGKG